MSSCYVWTCMSTHEAFGHQDLSSKLQRQNGHKPQLVFISSARLRPRRLTWDQSSRPNSKSLFIRTSPLTGASRITCTSQRGPTGCLWETGCPWSWASPLQTRHWDNPFITSPTWWDKNLTFLVHLEPRKNNQQATQNQRKEEINTKRCADQDSLLKPLSGAQ